MLHYTWGDGVGGAGLELGSPGTSVWCLFQVPVAPLAAVVLQSFFSHVHYDGGNRNFRFAANFRQCNKFEVVGRISIGTANVDYWITLLQASYTRQGNRSLCQLLLRLQGMFWATILTFADLLAKYPSKQPLG